MLFGGKFPFIDDENGKWVRGPSGYRYLPNFPTSAGGAGSGNFSFRGEYDPTAAYDVKDVVVISGGANAGSFVCIKANDGQQPQLPDTGNLYWVSLSGNVPVMGAWLT